MLKLLTRFPDISDFEMFANFQNFIDEVANTFYNKANRTVHDSVKK